MINKAELMDIINKSSFAMDDTRLFLNTHPYDNEARNYFNKMEQIRNQAITTYEANFGPLKWYSPDTSSVREWNKGPWPWQSGGCK